MIKVALAATSLLALAACGAGGGDETAPKAGADAPASSPAASTTSSSEAAPTTAPANSMFNAFSFETSGDIEVRSDWNIETLSLTGGCQFGKSLGLGFSDNAQAGTPHWFYVQLAGDEAPASGDTGTYAVREVTWTNGQVQHPEIDVLIPARLKGPGTLTVTRHTGRGMAGELAGTLVADLADAQSGETATINMTFDVNLACAP